MKFTIFTYSIAPRLGGRSDSESLQTRMRCSNEYFGKKTGIKVNLSMYCNGARRQCRTSPNLNFWMTSEMIVYYFLCCSRK